MHHLEFTYIFRIIFNIFLIFGSSWSYAKKNCQRSFSLFSPKNLLERQEEIKNKYRQEQLIDDVLTPIFVAGQEKVPDILRIAQKLQTEGVDPRKTHVPELARLHQEYIDKVAQVVAASSNRTREYFFTELNGFKNELERVIDGGATYEWAIDFGFRLTLFGSNLLKGRVVNRTRKQNTQKTEAMQLTQKIVQVFPSKVFIPVPYSMGIILFNRTFPVDKHPMELSEQKTWADHSNRLPYSLYKHDAHHGLGKQVHFLDSAFNIYYDQGFHQFFVGSTEGLTVRDRKMAEWVYYSRQHETKEFFWYKGVKPRNINGTQIRQQVRDVRPFLSNTPEVREDPQETALSFIFQSADVFERITQEYLSTQGVQ